MGTQENGPLRCVQLPGCKSTSQRMLILAATRPNGEQTSLSGLSGGDDTRGLIQALTLMGAQFNTPSSDTVRVTPIPRPFRFEGLQLDAGPAGSTFRFLLALLATGQADAILRATPRLLERPQDDLYDWLRERGVQVALLADGSGLHIQSQGLAAGEWLAPTQFTSQFLSGLALATAWRSDVSVRPEALAQVESCPGVGYWALIMARQRPWYCQWRAMSIRVRPKGLPGQPMRYRPSVLLMNSRFSNFSRWLSTRNYREIYSTN